MNHLQWTTARHEQRRFQFIMGLCGFLQGKATECNETGFLKYPIKMT